MTYKQTAGKPISSVSVQRSNRTSLVPNLPQQRLKIKYKLSSAPPATMEDVISR